ncbi:kinase-like domain-containing protein [Apodospora peruviana]|uniref:non-specific serine/threonine protein kinase n=1 Tax=Apodospora peruviana TaxID=516989 RepID=A0AAE0IJC1_9PEZI|nr:kinase-like domain-containing protein [Apodospora peruviana]
MPLVQVETPLTFDSEADLLGSGTVGEVFRAILGQRGVSNPETTPRVFALKRFFNREGRDDFDNERNILEALAIPSPHHAIVYHLSSWAAGAASYMLFPLAAGDLHQFLRTEPPPNEITAAFASALLDRIHGIIDAIGFVHDSGVLELAQHPSPMRRIGFHHDLKPANILLFHDDAGRVHWKLGDFGSGTARFVPADSTEELYNRKASTGDPVYSAPEYVIDGRVSRPKDIWSMGAILLEVLIWVSSDAVGAVKRFEEARLDFKDATVEHAAVYWCQGDTDGRPYLNPAAATAQDDVEKGRIGREAPSPFIAFVKLIRAMLELDPAARPTAAELCQNIDKMRPNLSS